jgi:hypothetical protein
MYGLELIVIIVATLAQSLTSPSPSMSLAGVIIFWRVIMGIGMWHSKIVKLGAHTNKQLLRYWW